MAAPKGNQYAKGHKGRAPDIYDDDFIENEAQALLDWLKAGGGTYIGSFAVKRGYCMQRMHEWKKSNKVFSDAYHKAKAWQEDNFINKALSREWDSGFTRYVMARVCDDKWKASFEQPESSTIEHIGNVTINKVTAKPATE